MDEQQQSHEQRTRRRLLWIGGLAALFLFLIVLICGYVFEWEWTGLVKDTNFPKRTLWDWMQLLIIPAVIAGGTIWFNQRQQARQQEQESAIADLEEQRARHNEMVKALQDKKESVAYVALQVREEGLPDHQERRAQLLVALYLAMLFQHSDRTRALVLSALGDAHRKEYGNEVMEMLSRLTDDFTRYKKQLTTAQEELHVTAFHIEIDGYIKKLKVLKKALLAQKDLGTFSQTTARPRDGT